MMSLKRRISITLTLFLVLLGGIGGWVYHTIYRTSDFSLRHAEAFRFRRMTVGQVADQGTYRYFFVTNRQQDLVDGPVEARFGHERGETLALGSFDAKLEPSLGLGMLINPSEWFQDEEIVLQEIRSLEDDDFVDQLSRLVEESPHRSLLVLLHGFRERFPSALRKTAFFGHVLDLNTPIVVFDWPGNQGSSLSGYRRAREVAEASGADLARTLDMILEKVRPNKLWLVANSMGGQVVVDALEVLDQDPKFSDPEAEIDSIVLTAPDVDHEEFDQQFKKEVDDLTDELTVYVSSNDRALVLSRLVNRAKRLGESTLTPDQLEEAIRIADLTDPSSDLITLVDVTPVNRTRNFHNFNLETPEFFNDLYLRLTNESPPRTRLIYRAQTPEGSIYYVLTRGR
jgi:esterase/lipase superfamily enzyme